MNYVIVPPLLPEHESCLLFTCQLYFAYASHYRTDKRRARKMTTERPHKFTLIQILALIAVIGIVLTIVLPRWLGSAGNTETSIEAEQ